jgi:hypothetical protein
VLEGVISPVQHSEWATPIVPVVKGNGTVRICGEYQVTLNRAAITDSYPLPRIDDMVGSLSGGHAYTKLALAHAYHQIQLHETSRKLTTTNTQSAVSIQSITFRNFPSTCYFPEIPQVSVYIDDKLLKGKTEEEHLKTLEVVLRKLEDVNIRLEKKCQLLLPEVEYLGHIISAHGIRPSQKKTEAVIAAPVPENVTQLSSFLGLMNYYEMFLGNLFSMLAPLHKLLQKSSKWKSGDA